MWGILVWFLIGFSTVSYIHSIFLNKIFAKFIPDDNKNENPDAWFVEEMPAEEDSNSITDSSEK
jgi:hypothetical protein